MTMSDKYWDEISVHFNEQGKLIKRVYKCRMEFYDFNKLKCIDKDGNETWFNLNQVDYWENIMWPVKKKEKTDA